MYRAHADMGAIHRLAQSITPLQHGYLHAGFSGEGDGFVVASIDVAHDARAGIVGQHAREPPPWCSDTHVAPDAVLSSALSRGQSAMASLPSFIASVSR